MTTSRFRARQPAPVLFWRGPYTRYCHPVQGTDQLWILAAPGDEPPGIPLPVLPFNAWRLDHATIFGVDADQTVFQVDLADADLPARSLVRDGVAFREVPTDDWCGPRPHLTYPDYPSVRLSASGFVVSDGPRRGFRILDADGRAVANPVSDRYGPALHPPAYHFGALAAGRTGFWVEADGVLMAFDYAGHPRRTVRSYIDGGGKREVPRRSSRLGGWMEAFVDAADRLYVAFVLSPERQDEREGLPITPTLVVFADTGQTLYASPPGSFREVGEYREFRPLGVDGHGRLWWRCGVRELLAYDLGHGLAEPGFAPTLAERASPDLAPTLGCAPAGRPDSPRGGGP